MVAQTNRVRAAEASIGTFALSDESHPFPSSVPFVVRDPLRICARPSGGAQASEVVATPPGL